MLENEIYTKFEGAEKKQCFVDHLTPFGSAFAATVDGDAVFLNARIVEAVGLTQAEVDAAPVALTCFVLLNYEDKRTTCRYRALMAMRPGAEPKPLAPRAAPEVAAEAVMEPKPAPTPEDEYYHYEKIILDALEKQGPMSTADLSEILDIDTTSVSNVCRSLHRTGNICRADVYRQLGQQRASLVVWAKHPSDFSIEFD